MNEKICIEYPVNQSRVIQFGCALNCLSQSFIDRGLGPDQIVICLEFLQKIYEGEKN